MHEIVALVTFLFITCTLGMGVKLGREWIAPRCPAAAAASRHWVRREFTGGRADGVTDCIDELTGRIALHSLSALFLALGIHARLDASWGHRERRVRGDSAAHAWRVDGVVTRWRRTLAYAQQLRGAQASGDAPRAQHS